MKIPVAFLHEGNLLDLEGDPIATGPCTIGEPGCQEHRSMIFEYEYAQVLGLEFETADCVRLDLEMDSFGFPPAHLVELYEPPALPRPV